MEPTPKAQYIVILYTTLYRTGGDKLKQAAATLRDEKQAEFPPCRLVFEAVESKKDFLAQIDRIKNAGGEITEFHFFGHSGVYGIMFGTTKWPEQFSPHEWRQMEIPFAADARCYFHACRTARWFAPFIARTLGVRTFGHYLYTTFSRSKEFFRWEGRSARADAPLYVISCPGRKSHGLLASVLKYSGVSKAAPMLEFAPNHEPVDTTYDPVAELYDDVFDDITVRRDEWNWLTRALGDCQSKAVLDIGCGNGAFLQTLSGRIGEGVGVDLSEKMLDQARGRCARQSNLSFVPLTGPELPFADDRFDAVMSVLSFRYLDWDPILHEILRVLRPGGQFVVIDMVAAPVRFKEIPAFARAKVRLAWQRLSRRRYGRALRRMVTDGRWKTMLRYNPMRSEHEMRWYLESRFPGGRAEIINVGWNSRILAFRSGPVRVKQVETLAYP